MKLTKEQQVTHLLNRFGLGATLHEVAEYSKLGVGETKKRLIEPGPSPENIPAFRIFFESNNNLAMDTGRAALWWVYRMLTTDHPGREKVALFWHSHFAVSGAKVEFGPMMMDYLDALTLNGNGKFEVLLEKVSKSAAMVQWLDTQTSLPGKPNENFAREVMELFTIGIGHYSEKDIQEAARAFSGWSYRIPYYEMGAMPEIERARMFYKRGMSPAAFQDAPEMHDNGVKTVLGETGPLTAEQILTKLAIHPKTAERLATKMWEFYAYQNPEPEIVKGLANKFIKSGGDIKAILYGIADSREFWSEKSVGVMIKSPVDYSIRAMRQLRAGETLKAAFKGEKPDAEVLPRPVLDTLYATWSGMSNQGLQLLFPPDVSGWKWGPAWASPGVTVERMRLPNLVFAGYRKNDNPGKIFLDEVLAPGAKWTPDTLVAKLLSVFQVQLTPERVKLLVDSCNHHGGVKSLSKPDSASYMFHEVSKLLFASPEFQIC